MQPKHSTDLILALITLVIGVLILFVWIPWDVESGVFEKVRRRIEIGDAFAPTLAAGLLTIGGALLLFEARRGTKTNFDPRHFLYALGLFSLFVVFVSILMWTGPALVMLFTDSEGYRPLRDTAPWKYAGFVVGGVTLILLLITLVERRLRPRMVLLAVLAVAALIAVYDLPFDDLLLPPNGDF